MAGIGFTLRQLTRRDDISGILQAYAHASVTTSGPWLATVLALGSISMAGQNLASVQSLENFRLVVIYNFALSLILAGPFMLVGTRQVADLIFAKRFDGCASVFLAVVASIVLFGTPLAAGLYAGYAEFPPAVTLTACINFLLVAGVWGVSIFLSTLKAYNRVTLAFVFGFILGSLAAIALAENYATAGLLTGFNIGLTFTLFVLVGQVYAEYPPGRAHLGAFLAGLRKYWLLAISGTVYSLALWIDKFLMWLLAPERLIHSSGLVVYPAYDSAMFLAFLTAVPGLSLFIVIVETSFFENYHRFYSDLLNHATLKEIRANQQRLAETLVSGMRNLMIIQGAISISFVLAAVKIYEWLGIDFTHLTIFRFGVLAAFLQTMLMFMLIVLAYFDLRKVALLVQTLFLGLNAGLTLLTIHLGYGYYGLGIVFAAAISFLAAYLYLVRFVNRLPYESFVRNNDSIV